jgi:malonyl CoA-acyl carrier protein transacylase
VTWSTVFLGIIAVATLATAVIQIFVLVAAGMLTRRLGRLADQVERELSPLIASLNSIGQDAAKAASLATAQVERVDRMFAEAAQRLETTLGIVQNAIAAPAREGAAVMSGIRAALDALRRSIANRPSRTRSSDDEDALFI